MAQNSVAAEISALNFQVQPNRDIVDLLERLTLTVKQLREDVKLKDNEIELLNQKIAQYEKISNLAENQVQLYSQMLVKQEEAFKILNSKVDNLDVIIKELKEENAKLIKKVATEKKIGNLKAIAVGVLLLGAKFL